MDKLVALCTMQVQILKDDMWFKRVQWLLVEMTSFMYNLTHFEKVVFCRVLNDRLFHSILGGSACPASSSHNVD